MIKTLSITNYKSYKMKLSHKNYKSIVSKNVELRYHNSLLPNDTFRLNIETKQRHVYKKGRKVVTLKVEKNYYIFDSEIVTASRAIEVVSMEYHGDSYSILKLGNYTYITLQDVDGDGNDVMVVFGIIV